MHTAWEVIQQSMITSVNTVCSKSVFCVFKHGIALWCDVTILKNAEQATWVFQDLLASHETINKVHIIKLLMMSRYSHGSAPYATHLTHFVNPNHSVWGTKVNGWGKYLVSLRSLILMWVCFEKKICDEIHVSDCCMSLTWFAETMNCETEHVMFQWRRSKFKPGGLNPGKKKKTRDMGDKVVEYWLLVETLVFGHPEIHWRSNGHSDNQEMGWYTNTSHGNYSIMISFYVTKLELRDEKITSVKVQPNA